MVKRLKIKEKMTTRLNLENGSTLKIKKGNLGSAAVLVSKCTNRNIEGILGEFEKESGLMPC